jgi:predicted PurR-regulated permease PerM
MTVKWFKKKSYTKRGQGTLEYILIIALIVIVLFAVIFLLRKQLQNLLNIALKMLNNFMSDPATTSPTELRPVPGIDPILPGPTGMHGPALA